MRINYDLYNKKPPAYKYTGGKKENEGKK